MFYVRGNVTFCGPFVTFCVITRPTYIGPTRPVRRGGGSLGANEPPLEKSTVWLHCKIIRLQL